MTKTKRLPVKGSTLLRMAGVTLVAVAEQCDPPTSRSNISHALQGKHHLSDAAFIAITELAGAEVATQVREASKEAFETHPYRDGNPYLGRGVDR